MEKPLTIDLYCGLGGWSEGFISEGYEVIGFDIERHDYGTGGYPGQLVLQDVTTLHGSQFKDAAVIVASPPCQAYSYRAMPWKRAKALPPPDNTLFETCFRIQREASEAAGRYIPMVVENVRGAQKWVGRAKWHFGSYYLWGDVPALMPITLHTKLPKNVNESIRLGNSPPRWTNRAEDLKWGDCNGKRFDERPKGNIAAHREGTKVPGINLSAVGFNVAAARQVDPAQKPGDYKRSRDDARQHIGYSRKAASAQIAKIPFPLASWIARCYRGLAEG